MDARKKKWVDSYADALTFIKSEVAAGASFPRIASALHARSLSGLFSAEKAAIMGVAERYGYSTVQQPHMGLMNPVRTDFCSELHSAFLQHILAAHVLPDIDAVFEIGSGLGFDLVGLAARNPTTPFYGGEIAPSGREALRQLAVAARLENVTPVPFDIEVPDFSFLSGKNVLVFSHFALVYANPFPRDFFPRLLDTVADAHVVLFEPVSFELAGQMSEPARFTAERARLYGICDHLLAVVRELGSQGKIVVEEVVPDISGRSGVNAVSLVRFRKTR